MELKTNVLYYGDNLEILGKYIPDESIDLIYLDPPFGSKRSYNILFRESTGAASEAQIEAFEDTWQWGPTAARAYEEVVTGPHQRVARMLQAMVDGLGHNDVTAYLSMMAVRLVELHRALKRTGSIYLHCDPTAGPYLRVLMDSIFGPKNFVNEIVWKRSFAHSDFRQGSRHYGRTHDTILFYARSAGRIWNQLFVPYGQEYIDRYYKYVDESGRRYWHDNLTAAKPGGDTRYLWKGKLPPKGRYWAYSKENMERLEREGRIVYTKTGFPMYKRYLDEMPGRALQDIWDDVRALGGLGAMAAERLGYATQKPGALLERIISASSNPGDVVLDPFCGCGTAVHAAHKLGRRWIGIDITHLAVGLIRRRMRDAFPGLAIEVVGEPRDLEGARYLASTKPKQFEYWVVDKLDAQPTGGKGLDLDGVKPFMEFGGKAKRAVISVKGTKVVNPEMIREVLGALDENKPIGVLAILNEPTKGMVTQAAAAGFYESAGRKYQRVQIITVKEMLSGKRPDLPSPASPFAKAPVEKKKAKQAEML